MKHRYLSLARSKSEDKVTSVPFMLYLLYLISFFLHLPARLPILGLIRLDFLLVIAITFLIFTTTTTADKRVDRASKYLLSIFVYSVVTIPLVEWPGSVINTGLIALIKGAIFFFFTVRLVTNEVRLKRVIAVFVGCNLIRVIEPLLLNVTTGYLGSVTHLGGGEFVGRLAGAPTDTINPNGLAFVIATVIPFLHYVLAPSGRKAFLAYLVLMPILLYTMGLTLSRSGALAIAVIAFAIWVKSRAKLLLGLIFVLSIATITVSVNEVQKDRYLSIVSGEARQSSSAEGRINGWFSDLQVAMNRPIIGHGLGASREANWNVRGKAQISHILWVEVWQEIGLIGLALFVLYLSAVIKNFRVAASLVKERLSDDNFLYRCGQAMQVWLVMNLLFSLASYGLKSYEWYFFGGLSVVLLRLVEARPGSEDAATLQEPEANRLPVMAPGRGRTLFRQLAHSYGQSERRKG